VCAPGGCLACSRTARIPSSCPSTRSSVWGKEVYDSHRSVSEPARRAVVLAWTKIADSGVWIPRPILPMLPGTPARAYPTPTIATAPTPARRAAGSPPGKVIGSSSTAHRELEFSQFTWGVKPSTQLSPAPGRSPRLGQSSRPTDPRSPLSGRPPMFVVHFTPTSSRGSTWYRAVVRWLTNKRCAAAPTSPSALKRRHPRLDR